MMLKAFSSWKTALFVLSVIICAGAKAQNVHQFTSALAVRPGYNYGREAVYTDKLAYLIFNDRLAKPQEGRSYDGSSTDSNYLWRLVKADSANRMFLRGRRRDFLRGGGNYFYLTYESAKGGPAVINIKGSSAFILNRELHAGDPYSSGWLQIPVKLKKGLNEMYVRGFAITATLTIPNQPVFLASEDLTSPSIIIGKDKNELTGAIVVVNASGSTLDGLRIRTKISNSETVKELPSIPAYSSRKVPFGFSPVGVSSAGDVACEIAILQDGKTLDTAIVNIDAVTPDQKFKRTFISAIDNSVQYYAVTPQAEGTKKNSALFLSVHGAGVEAISQARAYKAKDWGTLVAPTNRRPRGFNWEDWGRLDALEVLNINVKEFEPAEDRIYLTGHSMGGHGTWFLGATYPDKWAAIAPCAGYPTLKGYGSADGLIPDSSSSQVGQVILRSGNQSDVVSLASNYRPLGVYIFHGDSDRVVSVDYARQMKKVLAEFHADMSYYEYPGGSHWFGDHSVDWDPLFNFFKWHRREQDSSVNRIDFKTYNPGISSTYRWATIYQQEKPLELSRIQINRNLHGGIISGETENVQVLQIGLADFNSNDNITITMDGSAAVEHKPAGRTDTLYLKKVNGKWQKVARPSLREKGPHRYGTFKDAFNHNMVFVYGTGGSREENEANLAKAKYDAETWYYRGNGAVDIISDKDFRVANYKDRGVVVYGNKTNNRAWNQLLSDCPIQVEKGKIIAGDKIFNGDDLGAYFVWPKKDSPKSSIAVIAGTGVKGMQAASANQYFAGASGFPDYMIFTMDMLNVGVDGVKMAGFYDNHWKLSSN